MGGQDQSDDSENCSLVLNLCGLQRPHQATRVFLLGCDELAKAPPTLVLEVDLLRRNIVRIPKEFLDPAQNYMFHFLDEDCRPTAVRIVEATDEEEADNNDVEIWAHNPQESARWLLWRRQIYSGQWKLESYPEHSCPVTWRADAIF